MFDPQKLQQMMQQAREIQDRATVELKRNHVEGSAGGGMVRIVLNGMFEVQSVKIERASFADGDVTMVEDLVKAALTAAVAKAEEARATHAQQLAQSMGELQGM